MTSNIDVVKAWNDLPIEDIEGNAAYIADDFQHIGQDGSVDMNKEAWVGMSQMLLASFTDFDYVVTELREEGDAVIMTGHFEGKHTGDLDLSAMGLGVFPASGREIVWPDTSDKVTVEGGKIAKIESVGDVDGMKAFLTALGV
jgi:predicted ester cyclase